jgi:TetR/AcrR family transcriptional repressor of nem operon
MGRPSNKETILMNGVRLLRQKGYVGSSVRDISEFAGVPLGSFTNHFGSKEAFTLEVLNIYFEKSSETIARTLLNEMLPPLERIRAFVDTTDEVLNGDEEWSGCLIANLSIEASSHSEVIRKRLVEISRSIENSVATALKAAIKNGDLPKTFDVAAIAPFIVFSQHGAYLQSKVDRNSTAIEHFKKTLFKYLLK